MRAQDFIAHLLTVDINFMESGRGDMQESLLGDQLQIVVLANPGIGHAGLEDIVLGGEELLRADPGSAPVFHRHGAHRPKGDIAPLAPFAALIGDANPPIAIHGIGQRRTFIVDVSGEKAFDLARIPEIGIVFQKERLRRGDLNLIGRLEKAVCLRVFGFDLPIKARGLQIHSQGVLQILATQVPRANIGRKYTGLGRSRRPDQDRPEKGGFSQNTQLTEPHTLASLAKAGKVVQSLFCGAHCLKQRARSRKHAIRLLGSYLENEQTILWKTPEGICGGVFPDRRRIPPHLLRWYLQVRLEAEREYLFHGLWGYIR